jgi:gliding motility-associated-like protein
VVVEIQPVANAGLDIQLCSQDVGQVGSPGQPGFTYSWLPVEGLSSSTVPQPSVNLNIPSGSILQKNYILTVSSGSCFDKDTVLAEITPRPVASYLPTAQQCFNNNSFDFESNSTFASATPRFVWSFGPFATPDSSSDQNPQNVSFSSTGSQNVYLVVIDRGCVSQPFSLPLTVLPMPVSNFTASAFEGCEPMQVAFTNLSENPTGGSLSYSWSFGSSKKSELESPLIVFTDAGNYDITLTAMDGAGCSNSYTIANMITVHPTPQAGFNISPSTVIDISDPIIYLTDLSTNASRCIYYIDSVDSLFQFNTSYTFKDTGYFVVYQVLSTEFGCVDSASTLVRVDLGYKLFIPTSFSPNDDGLNDFFKVYGEDISSVEIVIFDRWGEQLYASFDKDNGWDGTSRLSKKKVPGGIYIYSIQVFDRYNRKFDYDGTVMVLK